MPFKLKVYNRHTVNAEANYHHFELEQRLFLTCPSGSGLLTTAHSKTAGCEIKHSSTR